MNHDRPFFSIVIPTRNRAHLLRYALQSALGQTFDDYEVVVSDNFSQDDTALVVKELGTFRVRYVRTESPLSMPDHWEFALDHAKGQYITYLCDDDALCPDALERVADSIDRYGSSLLVLGSGVYYSDNWYDSGLRNCTQILPYTGRVEKRESRDTLTHLFMCGDTYEAPRMQNSFCHRDMISKVRAESERIFLLCPDYSFAAFILAAVPRWTYIDELLRLQGVFTEGIGSTTFYNRGRPFQEFVREFRDRNLLERVPLKVPVTTNFIAETLLMVKERIASKLAGVEIDWERYFIGCWERILIHEIAGVRVEADKEEFFHILAQQPEEFRSRVYTAINGSVTKHPLKRAARRVIDGLPFLGRLESIVRGRTRSFVIRGEEFGFSNIWECASKIHAILPHK